MRSSLSRIALLLVTTFAICGCSVINRQTHHPWQMQEGPMVPVHVPGKADIPLGIVEFDDQGQLWRYDKNDKWRKGGDQGATQMATVLDELKKKVRGNRPVDLIIFVHGWNNNADPKAANNLKSFKETLVAMAGHEGNRQIFGVFVSWRGKVARGTTFFDIYNREASAIKIGRVESTAALHALSAVAHSKPENRVTAVGHSLGAVILLRAIAQPMAAKLAENAALERPALSNVALADAIVLVNPADDAVLASQLVTMLKDYDVKNKVGNKDVPLLVSLTSQGDWATGWVYHGATWISRHLLGSFMTSAAGETSSPTQEHATVTSVGFHTPIHSHELVECKGSGSAAPEPINVSEGDLAKLLISRNHDPRSTQEDKLIVWLSPDWSLHKEIKPYQISRKKGATNDTPYWILQVPEFVVKDHTDIWNPNFIGVVSALYYASNEKNGKAGGVGVPPQKASTSSSSSKYSR